MRARLWGTRGSIAVSSADTVRYGGNTAAVELLCAGGRIIVLDGGSGIRAMASNADATTRVDILLSHLHMDHVQGLPFFTPLLDPEVEIHVWGPVSITRTLRERITRYLSPPLFPVRVRELPNVTFHDVLPGTFELGTIQVTADLISHPGATLGYRLEEHGSVLTYMPDHEPALGNADFPDSPEWTSGFALAEGADVLIHDAQYDDAEYEAKVGWGHSSTSHLRAFAEMTRPRRLVTFHHDPGHTDTDLDALHEGLRADLSNDIELVRGTANLIVDL
ncbi:MAG TPA: MBL fold metallo-hydrolase [Acidimicrobiia bacterium]|nr:MBL fold metallo-hydrolase [Acidimicrobiia bacterium]